MNKKKLPIRTKKLKRKTLCIICLSSSRKRKKNSKKVTNFERIKKKHDYFVLLSVYQILHDVQFVYLMVNSLIYSNNFDFCITTFFLNRQTKHTKSFIPPPVSKKKKVYSPLQVGSPRTTHRKNRSLQKLKRKTTKKYQCLSNNKCQPVITTYLKKNLLLLLNKKLKNKHR